MAVSCSGGEVCRDGKCIEDVCEKVTCPAGYTCSFGNCVLTQPRQSRDVLATGAGGIACQIGARAPQLGDVPLSLLVLLGVALLASRRRRFQRGSRREEYQVASTAHAVELRHHKNRR